jgi:plasmid stabilization system protein ParE
MRIVFLPTTADDFDWITEYFLNVFPEGGANAYRHLDRALSNLTQNPRMGKPIARTGYRKYSVRRTPFCLVYRLEGDAIEILHIWDQRSNPLDLVLDEDGTRRE